MAPGSTANRLTSCTCSRAERSGVLGREAPGVNCKVQVVEKADVDRVQIRGLHKLAVLHESNISLVCGL
jgi:hypothetical protein